MNKPKYQILFLCFGLPFNILAQNNTFPTSGNVGIGTSSPSSKVHVRLGSSGGTPHGYSDLTIEDNQNGMISILTPSDRYAYFGFADANDDYVGGMQYSHSDDMMTFRVNNHNSDVVINKDGFLGVGTTNPSHRLHVEGTIKGILRHKSHYFTWFPYNSTYDDGSYAKTFYDGHRKQIRFWNSDTSTNFTRLETGGLTIGSPNPVSSTNGFENRIEFVNGGHGALVFHPGQSDELMFGMHQNGNFYWGRGRSHTQNPSEYSMFLNGINGNLGIRGKLTSNEVKVKLGGWADYVFKDDYDLPTLEEVEKHIKTKGHLINIPSAKEVAENGIQLGEMNKLLLEKIEELMLYTLQQEKKIQELEALKNETVHFQNELKKMKEQLSILNSKNNEN
ncbi:hypothetical protein [uncultured Croceitalea sp.]|uniref:hypothetical protein n=1 Tax=uncultured Croceitalea sp. TaxID=1798908 RepID=UPI0033063287